MPIISKEEILKINNIQDFLATIKNNGCTACRLCTISRAIATHRGPADSKVVMVGEALGQEEEKQHLPFVGPAATEVLDPAFRVAGMDTNNFFITNCVLCRPAAVKGSGKQNFTPTAEIINICVPYAKRMIELIKPKVVVLIGATAAKVFLGRKVVMREDSGTLMRLDAPYKKTFILIHPAWVLHSKKSGALANEQARIQFLTQVKALKGVLDEESIL